MQSGPHTGLEVVALQGLPIDVLLLTRESERELFDLAERELFDLAGNAMTSTVVRAALLSILAVSHSILIRLKDLSYEAFSLSSSHSKKKRDSEHGNLRHIEVGESFAVSMHFIDVFSYERKRWSSRGTMVKARK